jgi:hypothetical protein
MGIFASFRKNGRVLRIARALGHERGPDDFLAVIEGRREDAASQAEQALYNLCESDPDCRKVLEMHGATRADLQDLYELLLRTGAGQWVGAHYVPVSALAFPKPLAYLLANRTTADPIELASQAIEIISRGRFA